MARSPEFVLDYLSQVEALANDVLLDKSELTELSKKRDKIREGHRYKLFNLFGHKTFILFYLKEYN